MGDPAPSFVVLSDGTKQQSPGWQLTSFLLALQTSGMVTFQPCQRITCQLVRVARGLVSSSLCGVSAVPPVESLRICDCPPPTPAQEDEFSFVHLKLEGAF